MIEIIDSRKASLSEVIRRKEEVQPDVSGVVADILGDVKRRGDAALREYTKKFDGADVDIFRVSREEIERARDTVGAEFLAVLEEAAENIRFYHQNQMRDGFRVEKENGMVMGQRVTPIGRVGVYVPGGTAPYPSTVLMDVIPAKIAGVPEIVMVTPPQPDGSINAGILAAADVAGVGVIFKVGGAQAIAALAYGTKTIPKVDKIVGPGNLYVAAAKKMVYGIVGIDMVAGPSDILVVADATANPVYAAADMLGQAEHDENAAAVLVTTSVEVAGEVQKELARQISSLSRREIAKASLQRNGRIFLAKDIEAAVEIANILAPEHLELCVAESFEVLKKVKNAGSIFLGHNTPEALGDYFAGPNHTLPTMGTARFYSPLSVDDFVKRSSYLYCPKEALYSVGKKVELFAQKEGLGAHANSVAVRMKEGK